MASKPEVELPHPRAFVYVSAEDIFRPFIPARYIETKRQAELDIRDMMSSAMDHECIARDRVIRARRDTGPSSRRITIRACTISPKRPFR